MKDVVRVAAGQGFWGDDLDAPRRQVEGGQIDYLMLDYLAEVTMSILQKQKERDPTLGYARDFVGAMESILPAVLERGVKVVANAGGVNPRGCAEAAGGPGGARGPGGVCPRGRRPRRGCGSGRRHRDLRSRWRVGGQRSLRADAGAVRAPERGDAQPLSRHSGAGGANHSREEPLRCGRRH